MLSPLAFGVLALFLGQDGSWDLRNYHFYNPYAFLHGRMDVDVAPAHNATFYNPLLHLPFYFAVTHLPPRAVAFLLGTVQGMNLWLVYGLARRLLPEFSRRMALLLAAVGTLGAGNLAELGTSFGDNLVSLPVLGALLLVLIETSAGSSPPSTLRHGSGRALLRTGLVSRPSVLFVAGLLAGGAAGLKLPAAVFAVGLCAGFLFLPWPWANRLKAALVFGIGVLAGVLLTDGFWLAEMWRRFDNPLFPYFNDLFLSPWALPASYRDPRFLPAGWLEWLAFPLVLLFDPKQGGEVFFLDLRLSLLYLAVLAVVVFRPWRRQSADAGPAVRYLLIAAATSYLLWLKLFAIHRYALVFEMLAPVGVALALRSLLHGERAHRAVLALSLAAMALVMKPADWDRVSFSDHYFGVEVPPLSDPGRTLALLADHDATAYVIPYFPPTVRFLRIAGWFTGPTAVPHAYDRLIRSAISGHGGEIYVLARSWEREEAEKALAFHQLTADWPGCARLKPHVDAANDGALLFCAVRRAMQ